MAMTLKLYKLPDTPQVKGIRTLSKEDCPQVCQLLNKFLSKYHVFPVFTEEEVEHWFLTRSDVVYSYVVGEVGKVTDFVSFYSLPSSILRHPKYKTLRAAYSFYNVSTKIPWEVLMKDSLIFAKNVNFS